jgi:hypothetical protein
MCLAFGGGLPIFSKIFGYPFLPSQKYAESAAGTAYLLAAAAAVFSCVVMQLPSLRESLKQRGTGPFGMIMMWIVVPLLMAELGRHLAIGTYPMMRALVLGQDTALHYVVVDAAGWSDRKCRPKVTLASMPTMYDEVCGVPEEVRHELKPGMLIELRGRGTEDGLFYDRIAWPGN